MKKKLMAAILILALIIGIVPKAQIQTEAAATYSVDKALNYASANWNKNANQLCAEFVYNCVKAGGINISRQTGTGPCLRAIEKATGISKVQLKLASNGHATKAVTGSQLAAGDVVIQYCTTCGLYPHIILCAGYGSDGKAIYYGHNAAMNKETMRLNQNSLHKNSTCNVIAYCVPISSLDIANQGDSVTFADITATPSKYSCSVNFNISYTGTRPTSYGINYGLVENNGLVLSSKLNHSHTYTMGGTANPYEVVDGIANLEHNTTYAYQPFVVQNGKTVTGDTYFFTTTKDTSAITVVKEISCGYTITIQPNEEVYVYKTATSKDTYKIFDDHLFSYTLKATKRIVLSDYTVRYYIEDASGDSYYLRWLSNDIMSATTDHNFTETVVAPTYTEGGYTLYTCPCGHTEQGAFTTPIPSATGEPVMLGDVDENGKVEANDALLTLKQVVKLIELTERQKIAANVVKDDEVKADDALLILKYVVKLVNKF